MTKKFCSCNTCFADFAASLLVIHLPWYPHGRSMKAHVLRLRFNYPRSKTRTDIHVALYERRTEASVCLHTALLQKRNVTGTWSCSCLVCGERKTQRGTRTGTKKTGGTASNPFCPLPKFDCFVHVCDICVVCVPPWSANQRCVWWFACI